MYRILVGFVLFIVLASSGFGQEQIGAEPDQKKEPVSQGTQIEAIVDRELDRRLPAAIEREVEQEEDRRFRQLGWIIAIVGLVGIGTFGTLAKYVIEKTVENRLEKRTGNITDALEFGRFYLLALKLQIAEGFTQMEVDEIMNYLRKFAENPEIRHSQDFTLRLLEIVEAFASAAQTSSIDELFHAYEKEILSAPTLVEALLHHYGQEIVHREISPIDDVGYKAFEKLERVAVNSPGLALAYRTLYESKKDTKESRQLVHKLIHRSTKLAELYRYRFLLEIFTRSRAENWMKEVTPEGDSIQKCVRECIARNKEVFGQKYGLEEESAVEIVERGISTQQATDLSERLLLTAE